MSEDNTTPEHDDDCGHTPEQHECVNEVMTYVNSPRGTLEEDRVMFGKMHDVLGFDLCGEMMVAAKHLTDYHQLLDPIEVASLPEGASAHNFIVSRAHMHAHMFAEAVQQNPEEWQALDMVDTLTAYAHTVFLDGLLVGSYRASDGVCPLAHLHDKTALEAEEFLIAQEAADGSTEEDGGDV